MDIYNVVPAVGVGPVRFGMSRAEVRAVMSGAPTSFNKGGHDRYDTDAYHQNGLQISYSGDEPQVDYIELSRGCDFIAQYKDREVFTTKADDLVQYILQDAPFDEHDPELGYSYIFPALELSLWRPVLPEAGSDSTAQYFATIGVGIRGYSSDHTR